MVHGFVTPFFFFENNKKLLLIENLRHLDLLKLDLQTCHGNSQNKKNQLDTKNLNNVQTSTCNFIKKEKIQNKLENHPNKKKNHKKKR
jgi:hypothetical protein